MEELQNKLTHDIEEVRLRAIETLYLKSVKISKIQPGEKYLRRESDIWVVLFLSWAALISLPSLHLEYRIFHRIVVVLGGPHLAAKPSS